MRLRKLFVLVFCCSVIFSSCFYDRKSNYNPIGQFDLSKDDSRILFSLSNRGYSSIFSIDTNGNNVQLIAEASSDSVFINPKYSPDGEQILFIGGATDSTRFSDIYIAKSDGSNRQKITSRKEMIGEAIFSECENKIYYIKSNEYGHSSPVARDRPHGTDIYSIDLKTKNVNQVTNLNAYGMYYISELGCDQLSVYMPVQEMGGMKAFKKSSPDSMMVINPANNPRNDFSFYSQLSFSRNYNVFLFMAPYQLYIMNNDKIAKPIVNHFGEGKSSSDIERASFFNKQRKIIYTNDTDTAFYIIDYNGKHLKTLPLN